MASGQLHDTAKDRFCRMSTIWWRHAAGCFHLYYRIYQEDL